MLEKSNKTIEGIQVIIFDLYGTLIHPTIKVNPYYKLFKDLGFTPDKIRLARKIALTENFDNLINFLDRLGSRKQINLAPYEKEIQEELSSVALYPKTKQVLRKIKGLNIKLCLISNLASPYKKPFFDLGLDRYFNEILFSCDLGFKKPDPKIYRKSIKLFRVKPHECLMIGDSLKADVLGPKSLGIKAVHLNRISSSFNNISEIGDILRTQKLKNF